MQLSRRLVIGHDGQPTRVAVQPGGEGLVRVLQPQEIPGLGGEPLFSEGEDFPPELKMVPLEGVGPGEAVIQVRALGMEQEFGVRIRP